MFVFVVLAIHSCAERITETTVIKVKDTNYETTRLEDVASEIEVRPLVSNEPFKSIFSLHTAGEEMFILSNDMKTVYYLKDCELISKLEKIGRGPGEYPNIGEMAFSKEDSILYVYVPTGPSINLYKVPEMEYIDKIEISTSISSFIVNGSSELLAIGKSYDTTNQTNGIYRIDTKKHSEHLIQSLNFSSAYLFESSSFHKIQNELYITLVDRRTEIYKIVNDSLVNSFSIDYGKKRSLPGDLCNLEVTDLNEMLKFHDFLKFKDYGFGCYNLIKNGDTIKYWHTPKIHEDHISMYTAIEGDIIKNYELTIPGLQINLWPECVVDGKYALIIQGTVNSMIDKDEEPSPLAQEIIEQMELQEDNNPLILLFKL